MTNNHRLYRISSEKSLNKQHLQQTATKTNSDGEEKEESNFQTCHIVFLNVQISAKI